MNNENDTVSEKKKRSPRRLIGYLALIVAIVMAINLCMEGFSVLAAPMNSSNYFYSNSAYRNVDYIKYSDQSGSLVDIFVDDWTAEDPFIFNSNRNMVNVGGVWTEKYDEVLNQDATDVDDTDEVHHRVLPGDTIRGRNIQVANNSTDPVTVTLQMFYRVEGFDESVKSYNPIEALFGISLQDMYDNPGTAIPNVTDEEFYFDSYGNGDPDNPDGWKTRENLETITNTRGIDETVTFPADSIDGTRYNEFCDLLKDKAKMRINALAANGDVLYEVYYGPAFPMEGDTVNIPTAGTAQYTEGYNDGWALPDSIGELYNGQISLLTIPATTTVTYGLELELPGDEMDGHGYSGDLSILRSQNSQTRGQLLSDLYGDQIDLVNFYENEYMLNETTFWLRFGVEQADPTPSPTPSGPTPTPDDPTPTTDDPTPTPTPYPTATSTSGGGGGGGGGGRVSTQQPSSVVLPTQTAPISDVSPRPSDLQTQLPTETTPPADQPTIGASGSPELPIVTIDPISVPNIDSPKGIPKTGDWGNDTLRNIMIMGAMLLIAVIALWRKRRNDEEEDDYDDDDDYEDDDLLFNAADAD